MKRTSFSEMPCSVARTLDHVGHWWSFMIVRNAFYGQTRFREFQESLGIAKNILSARLKDLTEAGIMKKIPDRNGSKYSEYILTEKGWDLQPVLVALMQWGDKWEPHESGPPLELLDKRSGISIPYQGIRNAEGDVIPREELTSRFSSAAKEMLMKKAAE